MNECSPVASINGNSLPDELIERIIYDAWYTLSPPPENRGALFMIGGRYRWHFYTALAVTSRNFRHIALELPFRIAVFRNSDDAQFYKFLLNGRISTARKEQIDVDTIMGSLFNNVTVLLDWKGEAEDFLSPASHPTGPFTKVMGQSIIPDAKELIVERWGLGPAVEDWIFSLKSLIHVQLNISDITQLCIPHLCRPSNLDETPGRLVFGKWLANQARRLHAVEISGSLPKFTVRALDVIIKAQQITLLTKQSLKVPGMELQNAVQVLFLDTPPGVDGLSDISGWDIPIAVRAGLSCPIRRKSERLNIIVRGSGNVDQVAWHEAEAACAAHDVKLTLEVVYHQ
jgi:hypothetical protein